MYIEHFPTLPNEMTHEATDKQMATEVAFNTKKPYKSCICWQ